MEKSENNSVKPSKSKLKYDRQFTSQLRLYRAVVAVMPALTTLLFRTKISGRENMPKDGACFVCCNHLSNWDPVLLAVAVKRPLHFMAKKEIFGVPGLGSIARTLGAFPVDRENADVTAVKTALNHIKHENALGIFPQGTRCVGRPPEELPIKGGVGMMVYKMKSDVVPVSIYSKGYKISPFKRVYIEIGKPIKFEEYEAGEKGNETYQKIGDTIFGRICGGVKHLKEQSENAG